MTLKHFSVTNTQHCKCNIKFLPYENHADDMHNVVLILFNHNLIESFPSTKSYTQYFVGFLTLLLSEFNLLSLSLCTVSRNLNSEAIFPPSLSLALSPLLHW